MKVLISGAGIAGPTLAYWLGRYGIRSTIVESAPRLRAGGYIIDFWGAGFEIADRMGLVPELRANGYVLKELRVVGRDGKRVAGFPIEAFSRITHGRYMSLPRSELSASIFGKIQDRVETIFGDSIGAIEQNENRVRVTFERAGARDFDLVVGADGLHSRVRQLVFGPESRFEKYLGLKAAAFQARGYRPRDELAYVMYTEVGKQVARFTMRGDTTLFFLTFADEDPSIPEGMQTQKALLRRRFESKNWECPRIMDALDAADDLYFDRVSQIRMDPQTGLWSRGRVTLVGDAAFCVSLLAGQGSALAMVAAYILAGELHRSGGDFAAAFGRYQTLFGPFVRKKQRAALGFAGTFAPKSKRAIFLRNRVFNLLRIPLVADLVGGRGFTDKIELPEY
jgi:2-polyprenyl-6-methoxyphenol hydroxylase-like FAD-dependent oxidoreductase